MSEPVTKHKKGRGCICGCGSLVYGRWPYLKGHNKPGNTPRPPSTRGANSTPFAKHCTSCGEKLRIDNKTGLCKKCKKAAPKNWDDFKKKRAAKTNGHANPHLASAKPDLASGDRAAVSLVITEQQLDSMFLNWPLDDKLLCVQAWLDRETV